MTTPHPKPTPRKRTTPRKKAILDEDKSCPYKDCRLGHNADSTGKGKEHFNRYHKDKTHTVRLEGAQFYVRRDPSVDYEYVCLCGSSHRNRYIFCYHVAGYPSRKTPPCPKMYDKALEIVVTNAVCKDETQPMNYEPLPVDDDTLPNVDVEGMPEIGQEETYRHEAAFEIDESDHSSQSDDPDINRIPGTTTLHSTTP